MFIIYSPRVKETAVNMAGLERQGGVSVFCLSSGNKLAACVDIDRVSTQL